MATEYGRYTIGVETNHSDSNTDPSATSGEASIFVSGSGTAAKFYQVNGNGDKGTVLTTDLVSGDASMSAAGALTIANDAVESGMLNDNVISGQSALGSAAVAQVDELLFSDAGTVKKVTFSNFEDSIFGNVSGDATIAAGGALTIAAQAVENSMLADDAVGADELAANAVVEASIVDNAVTLAKMAGLARGKFIYGDASGDPAALAAGANGKILVADANGDPSWTTLSGDATLSAGAITISAGAVEGAMLADDCISAQSNLGGTGVADGDEFMFSDAGTLKALTGANLYGWVFSKVSGDATVAAGGGLTIANDAVENAMIADNAVDDTHIRLRNNNALNSRNAADDGDVNMIKVLSNNGVQVGAGGSATFLIDAPNPFVSASNPTFYLSSSQMSNSNGHRYSSFGYKGTKADGTNCTMVQLQGAHHGTGDDFAGQFAIKINDGDDAAGSLGTAFHIGSDKAATFYGTLAATTSFTIGSAAITEAELEMLDGITAGTSAASKCMVTDADGDILMPDSDKFELGASSDMQLYHDGTNSYIANKTGALKVATETSGIAVTIGHSTSEVTVADNLTVAGNLTVTGTTITDSVEVISTSSGVLFEGGTDDGHEGTLISAVAGADVTYTLPNLTGHIPLIAGAASNANVTAAEFALLDGASSVATVTVADGDGVMFNDAGTMKHVTVQSLAAYFDDEITAMPNLVTTAATTVGTIGTGVWNAGAVTSSGRIVSDDQTEATSTTDGSLQTDGGLSVAKSAVIGDDLDLLSDGAIMNFGADKEVTLTHVHDDGLLLNSSKELQFGDNGTFICQSSDGILKVEADSSIALTAPDVLISSSTSDKPQLELRCTNADANPGTLLFTHDSASPADDDELGEIVFNGDDDGGNNTMFAKIAVLASDVSNGSEDAAIEFKYRGAGAIKEWTLGDGAGLIGPNDSTYGTVKAHSFVTYSDETLKTNFTALDNPLEMVKKLNGLNYTWKSDGSKDIGFIAQEVEKVVPEVVYSTNGEAGSYGMDYSSLTALLTEAIKQQDSEITALKATLAKVLAKLDK